MAELGDYTDGREDRRSGWHRRLDIFLLRLFPSPMRDKAWEAAQGGWRTTFRFAWREIVLTGVLLALLVVVLQMAASIGT